MKPLQTAVFPLGDGVDARKRFSTSSFAQHPGHVAAIVLIAILTLLPTLALAGAKPTDDTYTVPGYSYNHGAEPRLMVQGPGVIAWIRFDLAGTWGNSITSSMVSKATIKVFLVGARPPAASKCAV